MSKLRETLMNNNEMLREYDDLESVSESAGDETLTSDLLFAQRDMKPLEPVFNTAEMRCMEEGGRVATSGPVYGDGELKARFSRLTGIPVRLLEIERWNWADYLSWMDSEERITFRAKMRDIRILEYVEKRTLNMHPYNPEFSIETVTFRMELSKLVRL